MTDDVGTILEAPDRVTLKSGQVILLNRIKSREMLKLMRIITHGAGDRIMEFRMSPDDTQEMFVMKVMAMLIMAIPDAETETIEFIFSLAKPVGLIDRPNLSKQDKERNLALWEKLVDELDNPALKDLLTIIKAVILREAPDLMELGKDLREMWEEVQTVGKGKPANPPDPTSLASLAKSTSDQSSNSATSSSLSTPEPTVDTRTSLLETPSVNFVRSPQQFLDDAT